VIVNDFNGFGSGIRPDETEAKLVIDADAVLAAAIPLQCLEAIALRNAPIIEASSDLQLPELATSDAFAGLEAGHGPALGQSFGVGASERPDHPCRMVL
jgi:hypothetical protein